MLDSSDGKFCLCIPTVYEYVCVYVGGKVAVESSLRWYAGLGLGLIVVLVGTRIVGIGAKAFFSIRIGRMPVMVVVDVR